MSRIVSPRLLLKQARVGLLALVIMISLLIVMTTNVFAGAVNVYDFANVLNKSQVSNEASSLPYALDVYTTNTFSGSQQQFASETDGKINQSNKVVMAIDVRNHYVYLDGRGVSLSRSQYQDAANAFSSSFRSSQDYTGATVAAIDSLRGNSNSGNSGFSGYAPGGNSFGLSALCCIGFLVLAALALFGIFRSRRSGAGFFNRGFNRGPVVPPYNPYNQPYNQGSYPPNYYGPGYNQNQGMNPLAAGGLGAAAGGFLGYELGKEQGEREGEREGYDQVGYNGGGDGGAGANFGGDNNGGGDWGGGGAGADFGGGNNNGGGDWGGGGGGSDFGGGGGGDNGGGAGSNF